MIQHSNNKLCNTKNRTDNYKNQTRGHNNIIKVVECVTGLQQNT